MRSFRIFGGRWMPNENRRPVRRHRKSRARRTNTTSPIVRKIRRHGIQFLALVGAVALALAIVGLMLYFGGA